MDNRPLGVFDSGVGGIVVISEIIKKLPNENIVYLGDTARFPYGNKSNENIVNYTKESIRFLISKNVKAIIIACGTASSVLPEILKEEYKVPIFGVIEPVVTSISNNDQVGLIATSRTINSKAWELVLKNTHPNLELISNACPLLASMAEVGWTENEIASLTIKEYLKPFKESAITKLILGCTHYPLFRNLIKKELNNVELIDLGEKITVYLQNYLKEKELLNKNNLKPKYNINLTDIDVGYLNMINNLLKGLTEISPDDIKKVNL